ncbi:helix-turn-helix transcriptional regulator [Paraburkholderia sp.]|uniref:helix-turn-helix transcriptional regulator n=1 Tax=Paraburkholderia sp. TaxID=1926495 RepID=UPI003C7B3FAB
MKHLIARTGLSRATLYSLMNPRSPYFDPAFPKKIQISVRSVGFLESELDTWIQLRIASGKKQS